jgi:hypothetical protein
MDGMQPQALSPHLVVASDPPPFRDALYPPRSGGQRFAVNSVAELLAEPAAKSQGWLSAVYARLLVASSGPVALGPAPPEAGDRLERARWLRIAPDADAAAARRAAWPALAAVQRLGLGVGSLAPTLVIVAERDPYDRLPLFARAGAWLFRALRHLGVDELTVYVTNALDGEQRSQGGKLAELHEAFARYEPTWLALGAVAHEVLATAEIEHGQAPHPAHERRFAFDAGIEGYAAKLESAGVHRGSGLLVALAANTYLADQLGVPRSASVNPALQDRAPTVAAPLLDAARMKFVLGEVSTIQAAARAVSDHRTEQSKIVKLARRQGWEVEREKFFADRREKAKASASEAEARRIGTSRSLAWEATEKMLAKINADLADPEFRVYAKDAKAMNEVALALSEKGDAAFDDEKKRLAALTPDAFAVELRKTLAGLGVAESAPPAAP